jgi:4-amino-4-deoxy-L-arabinose transferase-like glycosyltransferase
LAQAAAFLPKDTHLYFVGGTEEDIARMQKQYPNTQNIFFKHHRPHDEIPLWQRAADVLVLPNTAQERISAEDTSPMKLFEYMASGTPIVASRLPSVEEIADDSRAILVTPDDPQALAEGIKKALLGAGEEKTLPAREWVAEHTWEKRAGRISAWIAQLGTRREAYQHERIIFRTACIAALLFIGFFVYIHGLSPSFDSLQSDAYLGLSVSLYERGVFTLSTTTPYIPQVTHVPGYPFFLSVTAAPWQNVLPALFLQAVLFAFTAVFVYRLFEGSFTPRVRLIAALLFSLEPYTLFTVAAPLSETLFLFLFIGGLLLLRRAYEKNRVALFFLAGVLFGMSILVRPVIQYAVPLVALLLLAAYVFLRRPRALASFGALILGTVLVLLPWGYRNYDAFGVWTLSTKGPYSFYFFEGAELLKYQGLSSVAATEHLVERAKRVYPEVRTADDLRAPRYAAFLTQETLTIISESPTLFAKMYLVSLGTFFLTDGYRLMGYELTKGALVPPNITRSVVQGEWQALGEHFAAHPFQLAFLLFGLMFWSLTLLFAARGFVASFLRFDRKLIFASLACALIIAYFAILTGPLAQARYRIPATPFLFLLAVYGASVVGKAANYAYRRKSQTTLGAL